MDLTINGVTCGADAEADTALLWMLRDELGLTGQRVPGPPLSWARFGSV